MVIVDVTAVRPAVVVVDLLNDGPMTVTAETPGMPMTVKGTPMPPVEPFGMVSVARPVMPLKMPGADAMIVVIGMAVAAMMSAGPRIAGSEQNQTHQRHADDGDLFFHDLPSVCGLGV